MIIVSLANKFLTPLRVGRNLSIDLKVNNLIPLAKPTAFVGQTMLEYAPK